MTNFETAFYPGYFYSRSLNYFKMKQNCNNLPWKYFWKI